MDLERLKESQRTERCVRRLVKVTARSPSFGASPLGHAHSRPWALALRSRRRDGPRRDLRQRETARSFHGTGTVAQQRVRISTAVITRAVPAIVLEGACRQRGTALHLAPQLRQLPKEAVSAS